MGNRGRKGGRGGRGGGGGGGRRPQPDRRNNDFRSNKLDIPRHNVRFEGYYNDLDIVPEAERPPFWEAMRRDLPNSFRFTGSKAHALAVQQRLRDYYIPEITSITWEGQYVEAPRPVEWYPLQLAWFMTTPKNVIRRFKPFASFQKFLVAETDVGNITRQEIVSMIPPLVMDVKPSMTVLDLCAAPGSKSAQLIEMIHAGEEERNLQIAANGAQAGLEDDGRSTGLLIANDVDYKRAHMLVHQIKRLASPNVMITNHDATIFPSIKIASLPGADGKPIQNRYLKFDRILADVPCSGDGTVRKNMEIWKNWTPSNGLGLHATQVKILVRALQMLKVGGRVVYSTCSMNPVEDEAVLAEAISRCGGPDLVQILATTDLLPGLKRSPGLKQWSIMDKTGRIWKDYESMVEQQAGDETLAKLTESMFPPKNSSLPLDRAMRVYPHLQDTGAFFIAILEKQSEIKARPAEAKAPTATTHATTGTTNGIHGGDEKTMPPKRKRDEDDLGKEITSPPKKVKSEEDLLLSNTIDQVSTSSNNAPAIELESTPTSTTVSQVPSTHPPPMSNPPPFQKKKNNQPFEEPFKYLPPTQPELLQIRDFYDLSSRFPLTRFMVRNPDGNPSKNIYYTSELSKEILQENEGKGIKFVHAGVKMFVKQDAPSPEICSWRIQTDGLKLLEAWVGKSRVVKLYKKETLRRLLIEMFPRFTGEEAALLGEVGEQVKTMSMGCCVLVIEPTKSETANGADGEGLAERMVLPLWKSHQSLNLMLPKEERRALLLRLFNDDTPLVNNSQGWKNKKDEAKKNDDKNGDKSGAENLLDTQEGAVDATLQRNSSSPEPQSGRLDPGTTDDVVEVEADALMADTKNASEDEDDGGMAVS